MSKNDSKKRVLLAGLLVTFGALPVLAGSAVVGSVAGSLNATLGGKALEANTTLFSGDRLAVKDGTAVVALKSGSRMVLGRETEATFLREADAVTVALDKGNVSVYQPEAGTAVRVKIGELTIEPGKGYATEGDVAMLDGSVIVTAKSGTLKVGDGKRAQEVKKGQTLRIPKVAGGPQGAAGGGATSEGKFTPSNILEGVAAGGGVTAAAFAILDHSSLTCTQAISPSTTTTCKH
jgi:phosphohistidine swiveling domain-containing protein